MLFTLKMVTIGSYTKLVPVYQPTGCHVSDYFYITVNTTNNTSQNTLSVVGVRNRRLPF
jgi:hypothetical protein